MGRQLKLQYDQALSMYDALLMPTIVKAVQKLPAPNPSIAEYIYKANEMLDNTSPINTTGHPAISVPCGFTKGEAGENLPVGYVDGKARLWSDALN